MEFGWKVEFLNETTEAEFDGLPTEIKAKIVRISQLIEQVGVFSVREPYVRHVQGKIWEIRARGKKNLPDRFTLRSRGNALLFSELLSRRPVKRQDVK